MTDIPRLDVSMNGGESAANVESIEQELQRLSEINIDTNCIQQQYHQGSRLSSGVSSKHGAENFLGSLCVPEGLLVEAHLECTKVGGQECVSDEFNVSMQLPLDISAIDFAVSLPPALNGRHPTTQNVDCPSKTYLRNHYCGVPSQSTSR
jgi:hypothetical protein